MKLRIDITSKDKASAVEFFQLARGADRSMKPPAPKGNEWRVSCYADAEVIGDALRAIDPHLSGAFHGGAESAETATGRLRWEVR